MAGSTVTSTLDIRLVDDVSPAAAKVAASLKKMEAEALAIDATLGKVGASDRFTANLKRIGASAPQIEGVAKAYADFNKAQGIALGSGEKLTAAQAKAVKAWEATTLAGVKAVMSAEKERDAAAMASFEKTTALWRQETAAHAREVERQVADDRRAAEQRAQIHAREAQREQRDREREMAAEHRHQEPILEERRHAASHHGIVNYALQSAAMAVSAHEVVHLGREAWEQGAEVQRERIGLQNAGRTPEEIREIEHAARGVQASTPTSGFVESLKTVAETTAAFGSVEHAVANLPFISKMTSILKTAGGDNIHGDAAQLGQAFAKTFEERQTKPEEFEAEAKQMIPAMVATGGTFNPEQLYAFAQQAKSALPSLSMRFLSKIAPSLIGAQGGERAGTGLKAFEDVIAGKVNDKKQAEEFLHLGLLDPKMAIMKAGHAVGWKSGAVKDTFLAMTDPLAWSEQYLIPALKASGVDTSNREATQMILNTMFRNQNANMIATEIAQEASRHRLHKDEDLYGKVGSFDEIYARNLQDFGVAAGALKSAIGNLAGAVTVPLMGKVAVGLTFLAGQIDHLANLALEHPTIAGGAGVAVGGGAVAVAGTLAAKLYGGFGLKGSAVALTGSAHAIDAAAAKLGGAGGLASKLPVGGVVPAGGGVTGALAIPGAVELGAAGLAFGGGIFLSEVVRKAFEAQQPGQGGLYAPVTAESEGRDRQDVDGLRTELAELAGKVAKQKAMEKIAGTSDAATEADRQRIAQLDGAIAQKERSLNDLEAARSHEARVGRAMMAMRRPEEFGPNLPLDYAYRDREADRGRAFAAMRKPEEFGPAREAFGPALPPDVAARLRYMEQELQQSRALGATSQPREAWIAPPSAPAAFHPDDDRASRARASDAPDRSLDNFVVGSLTPKVDTSEIDAAGTKAGEVGAAMQTALNVTASPTVDVSSIDAASAAVDGLAAKLRGIGALAAAAASAVASAAGGAPPAGTFRAAANRQFAGASQTG